MRGERVSKHWPCCWNAGSSPHARGTPTRARRNPGRSRFIPACAGNARAEPGTDARGTVHPRMRGERRYTDEAGLDSDGSSPHARGTLKDPRHLTEELRFIPACAGNAHSSDDRPASVAVHPRMRGERLFFLDFLGRLGGSSPHARGTHHRRSADHGRYRFIPACAGNASPRTAHRSL